MLFPDPQLLQSLVERAACDQLIDVLLLAYSVRPGYGLLLLGYRFPTRFCSPEYLRLSEVCWYLPSDPPFTRGQQVVPCLRGPKKWVASWAQKKLSALQRYEEELSAYTEYCEQRAAIQALRAQARPNTRNLPEYPEEVYEPIFRFEDLVLKAAQEYERDSRLGGIDRDRYNAVQATPQALARYVMEHVDPEQIDTHCQGKEDFITTFDSLRKALKPQDDQFRLDQQQRLRDHIRDLKKATTLERVIEWTNRDQVTQGRHQVKDIAKDLRDYIKISNQGTAKKGSTY
ncbi:hypothetical protein QBC40DRAFT_300271 [Triangularia verruculosa]|uniref:Uncharacterized protein n=1 Tax=Triangularia verruculosa TaxID=2587418 RepID=A0AAN6XD97_9PEZI|nr:hypothetical protein QBC40DRAFT_300271 [Triangularia verruculosa]